MLDALVIGGGITGLTCAYRLRQRGFSLALCEKARTGGLVRSKQRQGFTLECGPNIFLEKRALRTLIDELGLASSIVRPTIHFYQQHVWHDGAPAAVPRSPFNLYQTRLIAPSFKRELIRRVLFGLAPGSEEDDCTVAEYFAPVIGAHAVDALLAPAMKGIYGSSIDTLSARSVFPGLWRAGKERLQLRTFLRQRRRENGRPRIFTLRGGIATLPERLQHYCERDKILHRVGVLALNRTPEGFAAVLEDGEVIAARRVFVATSGPQSARYLRGLLPHVAALLNEAEAVPLVVVHLAVPATQRPLPRSFGILFPTAPGRRILGVMFNSQLFPHLAPAGQQLLTVMLGGGEDTAALQLSDADVETVVRRELTDTLGYHTVRLLQLTRWPAAIPHYPLQHYQLVEALHDAEQALPGLFFVGTDLGLPGIADRVTIASKLVEAVR